MYYFILEQAKNRWQSAFQNKVISSLEDLQVVGEVAKANPIQKPEELCQMGLKKGYSTIVIIGADTVINTLGALIAKNKATLGIIPTDPKSSFYSLIGANSWEEAVSALPKRRVAIFDMGKVGPDKFFLTYVKILTPKKRKPSQVTLRFKDFEIDVPSLEVIITNGALEKTNSKIVRESLSDGLLDIFISTQVEEKKGSIFSVLFQAENKRPTFSSLFHAKKVRILGKEQILNIISPDQKILTRTPSEISIVPQAIKIIVKKAAKT